MNPERRPLDIARPVAFEIREQKRRNTGKEKYEQGMKTNVVIGMEINEKSLPHGGLTVKVVSQSRSCYSQGGVTVKVVSRSRWSHRQGSVTLKVASLPRCLEIMGRGGVNSQGGVTVKVVSQ